MFKPISKSDDKQQKVSKLVIYISKFSRTLWKRFADPQGSADHRLRNTVLKTWYCVWEKKESVSILSIAQTVSTGATVLNSYRCHQNIW